MKTTVALLLGIFAGGFAGLAGTNDTASALQRGLFEEEANQNLPAAIQAYRAVAGQFDKDRKLAATAVFRLGECYRKQGSTNEAVAQYERVLRDFSDQPQLVTLSRQQLRAFGNPAAVTADNGGAGGTGSLRADAAALETQIAQFKAMPKDQLRVAVQQSYPNPVLTSLMQNLNAAEQKLAAAEKEYGPQHQEVIKDSEVVKTIRAQVDAQVDAALQILEVKRQGLAAAAKAAPAASAAPAAGDGGVDTSKLASAEVDEVKRIQTMIKDSPDLINARNALGETPLYSAAKKGQLVVAKFLLANGAVVDALSFNETPLHAAAREGHKAMAELLLDYKASQKQAFPGQVTPLHYAAGNGYRSVAELLLDRGADVNAKSDGATAFMWAVRDGFRAVAELLIARGADVNVEATSMLLYTGQVRSALRNERITGSPLLVAANRGDLPMVELLLSNKADVAFTGRAGVTPLFRAAQTGQVAVAEALVSHGADVNARMPGKDTLGWTALHEAVACRQKDMAEFLLKNHADPNARIGTEFGEGGPGYTPLLIATALVYPEMVDVLLANKADPNLGNGSRYPILNALNNENASARKQLVKSLVDHGARLDVRDVYGNTPLLLAAARNDPEVLALLVDAHADVNAQDKSGRSALRIIAGSQGPAALEAGKILLRAGANPNLRDSDGNTPLVLAAANGRSDLVELLLANHADPNVQNNQGQTALDLSRNSPGAGLPAPRGVRPSRPPPINPANGLPVGVSTTTLPNGTVTIDVESSSAAEPNKPPPTIAEMLREHGALGKLPRGDQILISRPSANYSDVVFTRPPTNVNDFTLYELIAVKYLCLSISLSPESGTVYAALIILPAGLRFPDFTRVKIRRLSDDHKRWEEKTLNLSAALESGDCLGDVPLKWGDEVEIPETDHLLGTPWDSLPQSVMDPLKSCLTRRVQITVKGQATNLVLVPFSDAPPIGTMASWRMHSFMLGPVLRSSRMLLASSDLSRVKVTRRDPGSGKTNEWIINCSYSAEPPDFWVRDGDQIDVPERVSAQEPAGPLSPARPLTPSNRQVTPPRAGAQRLPNFAASASNPLAAPVAQDGPLEAEDNPIAGQTPNPALLRRATRPAAGNLEQQYLAVDGVLYSPEREDSRLRAAGYALDAAAELRTGQAWAERAPAGIQGRAGNTVVWTGREMIVFGGEGPGASFDNGARYNPRENSWEILPPKNAPSSRTGASAVWTDREMIVWGGFGGRLGNNTNRNDGSRYDPAANTWKPMSNENAPQARFDFSAVWSGKEMLVWGGYTDSQSRYSGAYAPGHLNSGGGYNPSNDSWRSIPTKSAPSKRFAHAAVWTGKEMLIWGGADSSKVLGDGGRYDPSKDAWRPISSNGAPSARGNPVAAWTGREMIVWGGATRDNNAQAVYFRDGARYDPVKDKWTPMSQVNAPKGRVQAASCWTGKVLVVWGGVNDVEAKGSSDSNRYLGGGALYNPETDTWSPITSAGAPSPRLTSGVWTGDNLLLFGGYNGLHLDETWSFAPSVMLYPYAKK